MTLSDATVLVADDEPELLKFLQRWFTGEGCRVLTAGNGAVALELVEQNHVDLIVSDVRMPLMDGIEMAARLKSMPTYLPRIMFVSGFSDLEARGLYDLGVEAMLHKPMSRRDVLSVAERCLKDKGERWQPTEDIAEHPAITAELGSLDTALRDGAIAFGRGGFCLRAAPSVRTDEILRLAIGFAADGRSITGQGIVRWSGIDDELIGVEIVAVDDANRDWVIDVTNDDTIRTFIPKSMGPRSIGA